MNIAEKSKNTYKTLFGEGRRQIPKLALKKSKTTLV
jgi:hypothetical protein